MLFESASQNIIRKEITIFARPWTFGIGYKHIFLAIFAFSIGGRGAQQIQLKNKGGIGIHLESHHIDQSRLALNHKFLLSSYHRDNTVEDAFIRPL